MNINELASALWTDMVVALRADGLIATSITQAGPETTRVMVAHAQQSVVPGNWLPMNIKPKARELQVVALDVGGHLHILTHRDHYWCDRDGRGIDGTAFTGWKFVELPQ